MANRVTRDLFAQMIVPARRVILGAACAAMGVSCGGGRSDVATETADPLGATVADAACEGTIALGLPRTVGASNRIAVSWQTQGFTSFSVLVRPAQGGAFEPVDAVIAGQSAQFSRAAAWRLDFPTARVRVRGCNDAGQCVDSNEQPLLDALLGSVVKLPTPSAGGVDDFGSGLAVSGDGNTLAVAGAAAGTGGTAHLHLFERDAQGRWQRQQVLEPVCAQSFLGAASLDGAGATLVASIVPTAACPGQGGAIEVFARSGAQWQRTARIADEPARVDQRFGALSLARDGRTLAVESSDGARVYTHDGAGGWTLAAVLVPEAINGLFARFGTPRLSGDGAVLAVQGLREIPNPQDPIAAPAVPDAFVALFTRDAMAGWVARTTVRSTKPQDCCALRDDNDQFATSLALDGDGSTLAVGAPGDNSDPSDTVGDPGNHGRPDSGAVWIFRRTGEAAWSRQAFVKAPGGSGPDFFGTSVALDRDGRVLAATALGQSLPDGVNRNQAADRFAVIEPGDKDSPSFGGAAYVFAADDGGRWTQRATAFPPLEPRTRRTAFDVFSMAFAADAATLVLGVQEHADDGPPVATSVFVY